jgi:thiol-disulfide isomerase/thioredoxin
MKLFLSISLSFILAITGVYYFNNCNTLELKIYETGISNYFLSGICSRILISLYFVIAILILFKNKSTLIKITTLLILIVPIYFSIYDELNDEFFRISILKNNLLSIFIYLIGLILFRLYIKKLPKKKSFIILQYVISIIVITFLFIKNPLFPEEFLNLSEIYPSDKTEHITKINKNKYQIIAFFSTACPYCEKASKKLKILQRKNPNFSNTKIYFIGTENGVKTFFNETNTLFNYEIINIKTFIDITNGSYPKFVVIKDSIPKLILDGRSFNYLAPSLISNLYSQ